MEARKSLTCVFAGILALVIAVSGAKAAQKTQYRMKFEKGKKYYLLMVTDQKFSQSIMGQEQNIEQLIGLDADFDVNDVDANGNAWVRYTYRAVQYHQKGPMGQVEYDSSKKDLPVHPQAQGFAALLGEGFSLKMTPKGQVEAVKGLEQMRNNVSQKLPEGQMKEFMMQGIDQMLNEEAIKEFTEAAMAIYPDKAVGVGDSWSKTVVISQGLPMIQENTWTLEKLKDGVATIKVKADIKPNPKAKALEMGGARLNYELSGKRDGVIEMQESTGQVIKCRMTQQLSGQMKMAIAEMSMPDMPEMAIPVKIHIVTTTEMSERK